MILFSFFAYTILLFVVSWFTSRNADNESFFIGNKVSPWYVVAYGMIGASLSGVTFISIPGVVGDTKFSYMVIVFGYLVGYFVIANVLMPIYYKLNLTSIYSYLHQRFGYYAYKTGASFFLLSRIIGASFRMFLVVYILQHFVLDNYNVPFTVTAIVFVGLILIYTWRGGIKTIVWTDTLQTTFMLLSVIISILLISDHLDKPFLELYKNIQEAEYTKMFFFDWRDKYFFVKQFISGAFIAIVMTGLDQDMMQKNLSCKNLSDAKKNMYWFSWALLPVNFIFLTLGAFIAYYAQVKGIVITGTSDTLFPEIALNHLGTFAGIVFIIGLIAAAYSSADSALTALTTSFTLDILGIDRRENISKEKKVSIRKISHLGMAAVLVLVIIGYGMINDQAIITKLFTIAGYTYGPLLGLFSFGIFLKRTVIDKWVPVIALASPLLSYLIQIYSPIIFNGYQFGFELLLVNGLLMFAGLLFFSKPKS
jgi:Na+/proline symporter